MLKKGSIKFHPTSGSDRDAAGCTGHLEVIGEMQLVAHVLGDSRDQGWIQDFQKGGAHPDRESY